jgi:DNA-binding response OmpR family regulator
MNGKQSILIVDDEEKIRGVIKEYAEFEGYETAEAADGMEAVEKCRKEDFDIVIMDVMMPRLDGFSAAKEIRKNKNVPVIMLSARSEEYDKLFGFEIGADDYVAKPFSPKELLARIRAVLARSRPKDNTPDILTFDGLSVNMAGREVMVDGVTVSLTPKEYDLLFFLVKNRGLALSRDKLLEEVWGYDFFGDDRTVDTHIKMLRTSIGRYRSFIITLRGMGYKFDPTTARPDESE